MKPYEINAAITGHLDTSWTATSIRKANTRSKPDIPFIELYFLPGGVQAIEINGAAVRTGVFKINIFTTLGVGTKEGEVYGSLLEEMFFHQTIGGVTCESGDQMPNTEYLGIDEALQACHHQVTIPFSIIYE
jgi:hypothetical protein